MKSLLLALCASLFFVQAAEAGGHHHDWNKRYVRPQPISNPVPEPSAMLVFGAGLFAVGVASRRKSD